MKSELRKKVVLGILIFIELIVLSLIVALLYIKFFKHPQDEKNMKYHNAIEVFKQLENDNLNINS